MIQLHVWGSGKQLALVDAECIAACWYLSLAVPTNKFEIITSSNISISGQLPTLAHNEEKCVGYLEIIRYLSSIGYDLDSFLDDEEKAINTGLIYYIEENLSKITDYTLFLNKDNFEKYSRGIFKEYLPFPMQYNTPIAFRTKAKDKCFSLGSTVEDKSQVEKEMIKNVPTVSKVQQLKNESLIEEKLIIKNSLSNMKCLNLFKTFIEIILNLKKELNSNENLINDISISSSDLLFLSHLFIETNEVLPDNFINTFLQTFNPDLIEWKNKNLAKINEKLTNIRPPSFTESANLFNLKNYY